jgi:sporulation protein YlmC with PRC-barrel domain
MEQQAEHTYVAFDPARELISSERVQGTPVLTKDGEAIGEVHSLLVNKVTGNVPYALVSHGGFMGINEAYHPVPWAALDYDVDHEGYLTNLTREELEKAPRQKLDDDGRPCGWDAEEVEGYYTNLDWWGL